MDQSFLDKKNLSNIILQGPNDHYYVHWLAAMTIYLSVAIFIAYTCPTLLGFVDKKGNRWHFQYYKGRDSLGGNHGKRSNSKNITELKALCQNQPVYGNSSCYGFNTRGELKNLITSQDEWISNPSGGLYVKVPGKKANSLYPQARYAGSVTLTPTS